jgi:ATP-binding cassette, subfamily B, bacterial PglK
MNSARQVLALLTPRERKRGLLVLLIAVIIAAVDTAGVASIMPFLAVLGNPGLVESNSWLAALYGFGGFDSREEFLFALGLLALAVVVVAAFVRAAGQYVIFHFANMRRYSISRRMVEGYLNQPYAFFLNRNSADLTKRALSDVDILVDNCIIPLVQMISYGLVMIMLVALLLIIDLVLAGIVFSVIGGSYAAIYLASRRLIARIGHERSEANRERFTVVSETFGGIKEVKAFGREQSFMDRFAEPAHKFARHKATVDAIAIVPRSLIEAVAFGGALILTLVLLGRHSDLGHVLPILGLYAFAGYRLMPAAQQIYNGVTRLRFGLPMVEAVGEDLPTSVPVGVSQTDAEPPLRLRHSLRFEHVSFCYPGMTTSTLRQLNLEIEAGTTVGLVGATGVGKTTFVDLLLGLHTPTHGRILVDGIPLSQSNLGAWRRTLGYVPQSIFLSDASIAHNIAFGIPSNAIDRPAVERAARIANIHEFIISLPDDYDTIVGERGVRLSGGQRQRLGIARALYHEPSILVFDEATSALDNATEAAVMEAIGTLRLDRTIIMIAHRLTTIYDCDLILLMKDGQLVPADKGRDLACQIVAEGQALLNSASRERET